MKGWKEETFISHMMMVLFAALLKWVLFSSHPRNRNIFTKVKNRGAHVEIYTSMKGIEEHTN